MSAEYNYSNLNVAVIGSGNWGKNHIRVFHSLGALYTICDSEPNRAKPLCEEFQIPFSSLDEILASPHIDACVIATPAKTHFEIASRCLEAKKHIFVEKPLTTNQQEAARLGTLASLHERILMVGHLLHFHEAFIVLKRLVQQGQLGKLMHLSAQRFTFGKYSSEDNVMWDIAPHDISMILSLMNEMPYQVLASSSHHLPNRTHDISSIILYFNHDCQAHITSSWIHPTKEQRLTLLGDKAMAVFDDCLPWENKLRLFSQLNSLPALPEPILLQPSEPLTNECKHFLECILSQQTPRTNAKEALSVTKVLEAAVQSALTCQPVRLSAEPLSASSLARQKSLAEI